VRTTAADGRARSSDRARSGREPQHRNARTGSAPSTTASIPPDARTHRTRLTWNSVVGGKVGHRSWPASVFGPSVPSWSVGAGLPVHQYTGVLAVEDGAGGRSLGRQRSILRGTLAGARSRWHPRSERLRSPAAGSVRSQYRSRRRAGLQDILS